MNRNKKYFDDGITLVALVVTIIVLLILAGVSLNAVFNSDGLFVRANGAATAWNEAAANEQNELNAVIDYYDEFRAGKIPGDKKNVVLSTSANTEVKDIKGQYLLTVPAGFKIASESPEMVTEGIVIEDESGNQYVWVPAYTEATPEAKKTASAIEFSRYGTNAASTNYPTYNNEGYARYNETAEEVADQITSVGTYGGFYIGRYEAGAAQSEGENAGKARTSMRSGTNNTAGQVTDLVVVKKGQAPYNYMQCDQAISQAQAVYGGAASTKLTSSWAWDTTIRFIEANANSSYGTSSPQGNYNNTTFTYTDLAGASATKKSSTSTLCPTGVTTPMLNIYDLGGNVWEWTTETFYNTADEATAGTGRASSNSGEPCAIRGGGYDGAYASYPAGCRTHDATTHSGDSDGFRPTLFL